MRAWIFFLFAASLSAQTAGPPVQVYIVASKTSFILGEPVKLTASSTDAQGVLRQGDTFRWVVSPPGAGQIDAQGNFTASSLMVITVTASDGGLSQQILLQALPKRIAVTADRTSMLVGSTQVMHAAALDINDHPIAGTVFHWSLLNVLGAWSDRQPMASIDTGGNLKSLVAGDLRVLATIPYATQVGFADAAQGETTIQMVAPAAYSFTRIFNGGQPTATSSTLTPRAAALNATEDGGFVFSASLDGVSSSLMQWKDGTFTPLLVSGRSHASTAQPLIQFLAYARNHNGEMLSQEVDATGASEVSDGPAESMVPLLVPGTPLAVADTTYGFSIQRNSLSDSGQKAVVVFYRDAVTLQNSSGLFRGGGRGLGDAVVTSTDSLPGYTGGPFNIGYFGIADDSTVWFTTNDANNTPVLWRSGPDGVVKKMLATGDSLQGSTVSYVAPGSSEQGNPSIFVAANGDFVVGATTANANYFLRWPLGDTTAPPQVLKGATMGLYWHEPGVGTLLYTNVNGKNNGLYLWTDTAKPLLLIGDTSLDGSAVQEIYSATANSKGVVFAMVRTTNSPMLIARLLPDMQVLVKAGDTMPFGVAPLITSFISGVRKGSPLVVAGGQTGSIAQLNGDGSIQVQVRTGDQMPDGATFAGSTLNNGLGQVQAAPSGALYFSDVNGLYLSESGTVNLDLKMPSPIDGVFIGGPYQFDVNSSGKLAGVFYWGTGSGLYSIEGGQPTTILRFGQTMDGGNVSTANSPALDDAGRLAAHVDAGIALWDGSQGHIICKPGMTLPDARTTTNCGYTIRASADGFVADAQMNDGQFTLLRYRSGTWDYVIGKTDAMPTGNSVAGVMRFDVNRGGDVAFSANGSAGYTQQIVVKRGGAYFQVQSMSDLTSAGELLLAVTNLLLQEDGTLYVLATNDSGQQVVYRGSPLN